MTKDQQNCKFLLNGAYLIRYFVFVHRLNIGKQPASSGKDSGRLLQSTEKLRIFHEANRG